MSLNVQTNVKTYTANLEKMLPSSEYIDPEVIKAFGDKVQEGYARTKQQSGGESISNDSSIARDTTSESSELDTILDNVTQMLNEITTGDGDIQELKAYLAESFPQVSQEAVEELAGEFSDIMAKTDGELDDVSDGETEENLLENYTIQAQNKLFVQNNSADDQTNDDSVDGLQGLRGGSQQPLGATPNTDGSYNIAAINFSHTNLDFTDTENINMLILFVFAQMKSINDEQALLVTNQMTSCNQQAAALTEVQSAMDGLNKMLPYPYDLDGDGVIGKDENITDLFSLLSISKGGSDEDLTTSLQPLVDLLSKYSDPETGKPYLDEVIFMTPEEQALAALNLDGTSTDTTYTASQLASSENLVASLMNQMITDANSACKDLDSTTLAYFPTESVVINGADDTKTEDDFPYKKVMLDTAIIAQDSAGAKKAVEKATSTNETLSMNLEAILSNGTNCLTLMSKAVETQKTNGQKL